MEKESQEHHEPKISLVEIILILPYLIVVEIVTPFLPFVGDLLSAPVALYLWFKGVPSARYLVAAIIELIPVLDVLPLLIAGFLLTVALDRSPASLGKVAAVTGGVRGAVSGAREAGEGALAKAKGAASGAVKGARETRKQFEEVVAAYGGEGEEGEVSREAEAPPRRAAGGEAFEKSEVEQFGMRPEPLSPYELQKTFAPPTVKDIEPPGEAAA